MKASFDFASAESVLSQAVNEMAFPAAVAEVGSHDTVFWEGAFGKLGNVLERHASPQTIFDLASLTKVIVTTTLAMRAIDIGRLSLSDKLSSYLPHWKGIERELVTIEDLLSHSSGLTAYLPFFRDHRTREEFEFSISSLPLEYVPRTRSLYSDLGFILLGFILKDVDREHCSLDRQFQMLVQGHDWAELCFCPPLVFRDRTAATEFDSWRGRIAHGEVHDENAWALGGVAGHAGLFGTARGVGNFAQQILRSFRGDERLVSQSTLGHFARRTSTPKSSRALGWDTMLPTSSCGRRMSSVSIGHTGFTGTSLWIDPVADIYAVLLTNRVNPSRQNDSILEIRPRFHDAIMEAALS